MGAGQAQMAAFKYPEAFASAGIFSGLLDTRSEYMLKRLAEPERVAADIDLLFISAGEYENICEPNRKIAQAWREMGIKSTFYSTPGYHDWPVWRYSAREFITRLWRQ
jgi:enterochelin esterase-like enzyme